MITSQTGLPDLASRAMSRPSSVPKYTLLWYKATPRLTTSQQIVRTRARGTLGSKVHRISPVFASSAYAMLHSPVVWITPLETSGVASKPRVVPSSRLQTKPSWPIFCALIWFKGLNRCSLSVFEGLDDLQAPRVRTKDPASSRRMLRRMFTTIVWLLTFLLARHDW